MTVKGMEDEDFKNTEGLADSNAVEKGFRNH